MTLDELVHVSEPFVDHLWKSDGRRFFEAWGAAAIEVDSSKRYRLMEVIDRYATLQETSIRLVSEETLIIFLEEVLKVLGDPEKQKIFIAEKAPEFSLF